MDDSFSELRASADELMDRSKRRSSIVWSWPSIVGYVWDTIRNLIVVLVVLLIFSVLHEPFQIIVASLLILIYTNLSIVGGQLALMIGGTLLNLHRQLREILSQLGKEQDEDSRFEFDNAGFTLEKTQYKFYLNVAFNFVIYLICVFNIFSAL